MDKNNTKNISVSQGNFVPLQQGNINNNAYGTDDNGRAEAVASADDVGQRHERLGVHAYETQGQPTLDHRWDTLVYEEGLRDDAVGNQLGGARLAVREESERLIQTAKKVGDYLPSSIWDTYGRRVKKPSGESVVFTDAANKRVIKFKDPFAYVSLKDDNPYTALYEHHIHNYFFGDVSYKLLGVSQDPVSGNARFVFEQPYIQTEEKPTKEEITKWFKERGFVLSDDGFWYSDGYVSFTDVEGDNCIKDKDGNLHFIDAIIKFDRGPKEVLSHYIERTKELKSGLDKAGIGVGSRFRVERLCDFNDFEVKRIDYGSGKITFGHLTKHPDYQYDFEWPINRVLDNIKLSQGSRWVQIDENRHDIVIPEAKAALIARAKDPSPRAVFSDEQIRALDRYAMLYSDKTSREEIFTGLAHSMRKDFKELHISDKWVDDMTEELREYAHGERRHHEQGLKR